MLLRSLRHLAALLITSAGAQILPPITSPSSCTAIPDWLPPTAPTPVVGNGTPASCTEQALQSALDLGGLIQFNCGPDPVVIPITVEHQFNVDMDTTLDGGGKVTLQGNGATRILAARADVARFSNRWIVLQNITITNGRSSGSLLPTPPSGSNPACSHGFDIDGGGGALYVFGTSVGIVNSTFIDNHAPVTGPSVGGGAIFVSDGTNIRIFGSTFRGNDAANGGAIRIFRGFGSVAYIINSTFEDNHAVGSGGNYREYGCPSGTVGSGGNGGALGMLGNSTVAVACSAFRRNSGTDAQGGAIWIAPYGAESGGGATLWSLRSEFEQNRNWQGGAVYTFHTGTLLYSSTFAFNSATYSGAVQTDAGTAVVAVNDTFIGNTATTAVGVLGRDYTQGEYWLVHNTFSGNSAPAYPTIFPGDRLGPYDGVVNNLFTSNIGTGGPVPCPPMPALNNVVWPPPTANPAPEAACAVGAISIDPQLGVLGDYGGGILTLPIPSTSPAARAAGSNCHVDDARGVPRDSVCAVGAYEPK